MLSPTGPSSGGRAALENRARIEPTALSHVVWNISGQSCDTPQNVEGRAQ